MIVSASEFAALPWPQQCACLRALDNAASAIQGRTYGEAQRKRAPLYADARTLQAIHDAQVKAWAGES